MTKAATRDIPRFDPVALRELAGPKVFARGEAYFQAEQVRILAIDKTRVLACVAGSEDYRTEVTGQRRKIGGTCSCPAFTDWGFCKHMIATALAANAAAGDPEAGGAMARIRAHLEGLSTGTLVGMVLELAEHDPVLFARLDLVSATHKADDRKIEARLRQALDRATQVNGFVEYREVPGWAARVSAVLDAVAALVADRRGAVVLRLAGHALDAIAGGIGAIDDSDGHGGELLGQAAKIHCAAAAAARPDPVAFARELFHRVMADEYDIFAGTEADYADTLGEDGLAEYRRLAQAAWAELTPQRRGGESEWDGRRHTLLAILDFFAAGDGDVDARIALRAGDLASQWSYAQLAEFCRAQGREAEALRWAREGLWVRADDRQDARLVILAAELLAGAGQGAEAEAVLWAGFAKEPSLELYERVRAHAGEAACARAVDLVAAQKQPGWGGPVELTLRILMREQRFDAAWAAARGKPVAPRTLLDLAKASEATHGREALAVYAAEVEQLIGRSAYEPAVALLARMARLQPAAEHAACLADIKLRHGRKRNLMKLLA